jgi:hypothetical protein
MLRFLGFPPSMAEFTSDSIPNSSPILWSIDMNESNTTLPIRLFIGSSPKNTIEEAIFRYTLKKYTQTPIEINVINGQAGTVTTLNTGEVKQVPMALIGRIKGATAFSMARWAIPAWCGYQGRAIYCDSDQLALSDLIDLWQTDLGESTLAAVPARAAKSAPYFLKHFLKPYLDTPETYYLASVMVIDCEKAAIWSLESLIERLDRHEFSLPDLMYMGSSFRDKLGLTIQSLPAEWNHLDYVDAQSKLVHFTDLTSQPWRFDHNPVSDLWESYYLEAIAQNFLSLETIATAHANGWINRRIKALATMNPAIRRPVNWIWRGWNAQTFLLNRWVSEQLGKVKRAPAKLTAQFNRMKGVPG